MMFKYMIQLISRARLFPVIELPPEQIARFCAMWKSKWPWTLVVETIVIKIPREAPPARQLGTRRGVPSPAALFDAPPKRYTT
jgi:hypothetical protein